MSFDISKTPTLQAIATDNEQQLADDLQQRVDAGLRLAEGDPGQVHPPDAQKLDALRGGVGRAELQGDVRVPAAEGDERFGHEMPHRDAAGGDADRAAMAVAELAQAAERGVEGGDAAKRRLVKDPPGRRRGYAAGLALDQSQAGFAFEALDVLADRRLGAGQASSDRAQVARLVHRDEHAQVIERHIPKVSL